MPLSFHVSSVMPERAKTWAMLTRSPPLSRVASRLASQSIPNSAWPLEHDLLRDDVRAAGLDRHVEALVVVVPLLERGVVAGELGLRAPT